MKRSLAVAIMGVLAGGCASQWKIHGGPKECTQMCQGWNMELVGMVGVGNQDETGPGATACVCQVPGKKTDDPTGASGTATSTAAVIVAIQEAEEAQRRSAAAAQAR